MKWVGSIGEICSKKKRRGSSAKKDIFILPLDINEVSWCIHLILQFCHPSI